MRESRPSQAVHRRATLLAVCAVAALATTVAQAATPQASVAPSELGFAAQRGTDSERRLVKVTNDGDAELTISTIAVTGADAEFFKVDIDGLSDGCATSAPLPASDSCQLGVTFAPAAAGAHFAKLALTTNGGNPSVDLKGTATSVVPPPPPPPPAPGDRDGDGVSDNADRCPTVPGVLVNGCPVDRDGDGVLDPADRCPTVAGTLADGCPKDADKDGVVDGEDGCVAVAGNLKNGCPGELNAYIRGRWRVNRLLSQLVSLTVRTTIGSRIEVRCGGRGGCGFKQRTINKTTRQVTSLTRLFKGRRLLRARVSIVVLVTRPEQIGTYQSLRTRTGRKLPTVAQRCIAGGTRAKVVRCS